ncbi:MAG TPA: N-acetyltransferase [Candidatus Limnocylindria bacterium]
MLWRGRLLLIRPERTGEEATLRQINDAAFGGPREGGIVDAIRGSDRWIDGGSLVAEGDDGRPVGHLLLSEGDLVAADGARRRIWMIGPVAVLPALQRQGIGSSLMNAAIRFATERGQPVLCLLGHADYYPRFGFEPARGIGIEPPEAWADENWLALRLPAWTPTIRGTARFPTAFESGPPAN